MSLFIIGSVSRITSNIVHHLSKNSQFKSVTIADLLPTYQYHHRFYRLQKQLDKNQSKLQLNLTRLSNLNDIKKHENYDQVLYVTHDYYQNVTSKTRLLELTAEACRKRKYLYFATPAEYDHYGYDNPQAHYKKSQKRILQLNPNSTIIRSDIVDSGELSASLKQASLSNFKPKTVSGSQFVRVVCETISSKTQGKKILVRASDAAVATENNSFATRIQPQQYNHAKQNINNLISKFKNYTFKGYNGQVQVQEPKIKQDKKNQKSTQKVEKKEESKQKKAEAH